MFHKFFFEVEWKKDKAKNIWLNSFEGVEQKSKSNLWTLDFTEKLSFCLIREAWNFFLSPKNRKNSSAFDWMFWSLFSKSQKKNLNKKSHDWLFIFPSKIGAIPHLEFFGGKKVNNSFLCFCHLQRWRNLNKDVWMLILKVAQSIFNKRNVWLIYVQVKTQERLNSQ